MIKVMIQFSRAEERPVARAIREEFNKFNGHGIKADTQYNQMIE